eukprot:753784-Hanusia_phi.AAC.11
MGTPDNHGELRGANQQEGGGGGVLNLMWGSAHPLVTMGCRVDNHKVGWVQRGSRAAGVRTRGVAVEGREGWHEVALTFSDMRSRGDFEVGNGGGSGGRYIHQEGVPGTRVTYGGAPGRSTRYKRGPRKYP